MHEHQQTLFKGLLGVAGTLGSAAVSMVSNLEQWLRITSLVVGIVVGLVTIISIVKNGWRK